MGAIWSEQRRDETWLEVELAATDAMADAGLVPVEAARELRAKARVGATTHFQDAAIVARVSSGLGEPMVGISTQTLDPSELLETRGW